ncbi:MAG: vitamin K epoxide reductase family protein [Actinomycetota bacterium]|nr:vitamin K epoxide reductase family protein [Actinomycetota bacterium]
MTPRWVMGWTFWLAMTATAVSAYLTIAHFTTPNLLACSASGTINCARVTTSAQSRVVGIPVALLGLVWSIAMLGLCSPVAWNTRARWIKPTRLTLVCIGMLSVLWLVYAELFIIRAICLWCSAMHAVTFALFALLAPFGWMDETEGDIPAGQSL